MKNTSNYLAICSAITAAGCLFAGVKIVKSFKRCRKDMNAINDMEVESSSYEEELAEIQLKHAAEMAALREEDERNKKEHEKRMEAIKTRHVENVKKINLIREELFKNIDMRRFASPEEAKKLEERNSELLKELREIRM